jgi:hypothetical protein
MVLFRLSADMPQYARQEGTCCGTDCNRLVRVYTPAYTTDNTELLNSVMSTVTVYPPGRRDIVELPVKMIIELKRKMGLFNCCLEEYLSAGSHASAVMYGISYNQV